MRPMNRRAFLRYSGLATGGITLSRWMTSNSSDAQEHRNERPSWQIEEATIVKLQRLMASGQLTARQLVQLYLDRIETLDRKGPTLRAILEINPQALMIADALDE